jgi:hypothetical protein
MIPANLKLVPPTLKETHAGVGGRHPVPEIIIYEHSHFNTGEGDREGFEFRTNLAVSWIGDWNDRISSIIIVSGVWRFYNDADFDVKSGIRDLDPGYYANFKEFGDVISSFQPISF